MARIPSKWMARTMNDIVVDSIVDTVEYRLKPGLTGEVEIPSKYVQNAVVPCGKCKLCCQNHSAVLILPSHGDDPASYSTMTLPGVDGLFLTFKKNGDCSYLGPDGCTIHDRAPFICRTYDCRNQHKMYTKEQRDLLIKKGLLAPKIMKQAAILIHQELKSKKRDQITHA
jgi:Fe-S-cluster containining protein